MSFRVVIRTSVFGCSFGFGGLLSALSVDFAVNRNGLYTVIYGGIFNLFRLHTVTVCRLFQSILIDKILETYNSTLYDTSALRLAEKEFSRVENSLSNLIAAVENGFYSETTNTRLKELEVRKTELKEIIVIEKAKEIKPLEREQVTKYMSYAISQPSQVLIDLLVRKTIVRDEVVDIYLKYA